MQNDFIAINFAPLIGLLFLLIFLLTNRKLDRKILRTFYVAWGLELLELICYSAELWTATFEEPTVWRILLSAVGYSIRPFLLYAVFRLSVRDKLSERSQLWFAVPAILNVVASFSAFFTDVVFSYNAANEFVRGPLGYMTHIILFLYLICVLVCTMAEKGSRLKLENTILWAVCAIIVLAIVMEAAFSVRSLGRTAIVLSTVAYYLYFQTRTYDDQIKAYMENTISSQKEHLREMNIIGVLANEYVTVCYVDVKNDVVTPYRITPVLEERYGEALRSGVTFEQVFRAYVTNDVFEEDRAFFIEYADLATMISYLKQNGTLSKKYRVLRNGSIVYCEMRVELVALDDGTEDMVFGFSNNDERVRREMVYQTTVKQEIDKVEKAKNSLSGIAELAKQLQEAIEEKLSEL